MRWYYWGLIASLIAFGLGYTSMDDWIFGVVAVAMVWLAIIMGRAILKKS